MSHKCEEYLVWRRDHLERNYWKLTSTVRQSGFAAFVPLILLLAAAFSGYGEGDPFTRIKLAAYAAVAFFVALCLVIHARARSRREEVEEELYVLQSVPQVPGGAQPHVHGPTCQIHGTEHQYA